MLLLNSRSATYSNDIIIFAELTNNFCLVRQDSTEVLIPQFYSPLTNAVMRIRGNVRVKG